MLDELLEYHQTPEAEPFVADVMKLIERQQKMRKLILVGSAVIGGAFGVLGASLVSGSIANLVTQLTAGDAALPLGLAVMSAVAFIGWLLHDETRMTA